MQTTQLYKLGAKQRLKSSKSIDLLFKTGKSYNELPLRVIYAINNLCVKDNNKTTTYLQAGFGVSKKNFKKAVDRNRIKRLMRETYRLQKNDLENLLIEKNKSLQLFFIFNNFILPDYNLVHHKMNNCLKKMLQKINETHTTTI